MFHLVRKAVRYFSWQWQLGNAQLQAPEDDPESASLGLYDWKVINMLIDGQ